MKKLLVVVLILGFGSSAMAQTKMIPMIGDSATYSQTDSTDLTSELVMVITGINTATGVITEDKIIQLNGTSIKEGQYTKTLEDYNEEHEMVLKCNHFNNPDREQTAILESITVKAGTFQTCHLKTRNFEIWYGPVPHGFVKEVIKIAGVLVETLELKTFVKN